MPVFRSIASVSMFLAFLSSTFIGCAKDVDSHVQNAEPHVIGPKPQEEAKSLAEGAKVYCSSDSSDQCSPSVGMLVSLSEVSSSNETNVSQCSAFLISPQIVMTNSHCIPADLKRDNSNCSGRMWINFPELKGHIATRTGCDKVIYSSFIPENKQIVSDYAILKLEKPLDRPYLEVDRSGFKDTKSYQVIKVDPQSSNSVLGRMSGVKCRATHHSMVVPGAVSDESPNMTMADCSVIHGNSGAPILGSLGKVHGIIQSTYNSNDLSYVLSSNSISILDYDIALLAVGTSLACLRFPSDINVSQIPASCAANERSARELEQITADNLNKNAQESISAELERLVNVKYLLPSFQWSVKDYSGNENQLFSESNTSVYVPVPFCIKDLDSLLNGYSRWYYLGGYVGDAEKNIGWPKITVKVGVNRYIVPSVKVVTKPHDHFDAILRYNPSELSKKNATSFILNQVGWLGRGAPLFEERIGLCQ